MPAGKWLNIRSEIWWRFLIEVQFNLCVLSLLPILSRFLNISEVDGTTFELLLTYFAIFRGAEYLIHCVLEKTVEIIGVNMVKYSSRNLL